MTEMPTPSFLQNHSTAENHERMKAVLPADIDISEGGHAWNMTRPTALIAAELCEFILPQVIRLILPEYSNGEFLDSHAKMRAITRHAATVAIGEITITGDENTVIPAGSVFYTAAINDEPSVEYKTLEKSIIPASGSIIVGVQCTQAGVIGNTAANTIIFGDSKITGITAVTNEEEIAGGTEIEDDESLIERILAYDRSQGDSYVGNVADYKRWASSVDGVGGVTVVPAQDDSGVVTLIITDANGKPATEQLCESVYNYIMNPDNPDDRRANINAILSVVPPATMNIAIKATVELKEGVTIDSVKLSFISMLSKYLPVAMEEKEIKYTKIYSALSMSEGVNDFSDLQICAKGEEYSTNNITIETQSLPDISADDIELTAGTV